MFKIKNKKAFTIIELIVVMAIIGILVLLAMPKFMGHTKEAKFTKLIANTKLLENASERYYMDKNDWPRLTDVPYTSVQIKAFAQKVYDTTGKEVTLDLTGNYYDIDYAKLSQYIHVPDDNTSYIIQNPVGSVYSLEGLTATAKDRLNPPVEVPILFTTATFTNSGAIGRFGPTQAQLNISYVGTEIEGKVTSTNGVQLWTVPKTGKYRIETYGAKGYGGTFNTGAIMKGDVLLTKGTQLKILVGQMGQFLGGGGGTFVSTQDNTPIMIAGGGGAYGNTDGSPATTSINGSDGFNNIGSGGVNGNAGIRAYGGAGFTGNPTGDINVAKSFINGGIGGFVSSRGSYGGFGGGAAGDSEIGMKLPEGYPIAYFMGGGGGGYSGGGGGSHLTGNTYGCFGGGGGSYNTGTNPVNSVGNADQGKVIVTFIN